MLINIFLTNPTTTAEAYKHNPSSNPIPLFLMAVVVEEDDGKPQTQRNVAIIFGVTGLVGKELARKLISDPFWAEVYGIARSPDGPITENRQNYRFISCELLSPSEAQQKLSPLKQSITHVFWVTWASCFPLDSPECCEQNKSMLVNALDALLSETNTRMKTTPLKHVSLQTGTKHYVSLESSSSGGGGGGGIQCFDEESPRVRSSCHHNFYYCLEDLLREKLAGKTPWSVHRPGMITGSSRRSAFNVMGCLGVYGAICRKLRLPFVFGGTRECWEERFCVDASDARLVADQHIWAARKSEIHDFDLGQAFNAVNGGGGFVWREIWRELGLRMGVEVPAGEEAFSPEFRYAAAMGDKGRVWEEIVAEEGLMATEMGELANWGFMDALFRCPVKMLGSREKADRMGFKERYETLDSILYWIGCMRDEKLIP